MLEELRQRLRYPKEFYIGAMPAPDISEASINQWLKDLRSMLDSASQVVTLLADHGMLANLCLEVWRTERNLLPMLAHQKSDEAKSAGRSFKRLKEALDDARIEIVDPIGKPYDSGMSEKALTFEERPELRREVVIETVKPTIYLEGKIISHGEVIVGKPARKGEI